MKIFLTNDDGFDAPGILTLKQGLEEKGHEVWICAPSVARSTTSQSMTFHGDIIIEKHGESITLALDILQIVSFME